jgi:hypothetical protein
MMIHSALEKIRRNNVSEKRIGYRTLPACSVGASCANEIH